MPNIWPLILLTVLLLPPLPACADKAQYLELARRGWNYGASSGHTRPHQGAIDIHINGRDLAGASFCLIGEVPHPQTLEVLDAFRALIRHSFGKPMPVRYAGPRAAQCGAGRSILLRLYSGHPPERDFSDDLHWMSSIHQLGLPKGRRYAVVSPAMAQTLFGRRGQGTHLMVQQPGRAQIGPLETAFFKSLLIEELFQSMTFGRDVLIINRGLPFLSKLQEIPLNPSRLPWSSRAFMRALLRANPGRLCAFDLFMLHAVARAPVDQTIGMPFLNYIDGHFDELSALSETTLHDPQFEAIVDPMCGRTP